MQPAANIATQDALLHHQETWELIKQDLMRKYGESIYKSWFSKLELDQNSSDHSVIMNIPTKFMKDWISTNYFDLITQLWTHYDQKIHNVEIIVKHHEELVSNNNSKSQSLQRPFDISEGNSANIEKQDIFSFHLDPRLTFENFITGTPNELAYAASRAVAESQNVLSESNPLFLYGGVGLGKTHLMHAIANYIKQNSPQRKVIYMSAEKFMYQFVKALRNKDVMSFKEQFRSVDVLMIDDIQFICGKNSTQEEFFHTFNALIDSNRQMIISCDRSPSDLDNIEDRIKSRLGWGLVADIHCTTYELRLGILQSKIELMEVEVPNNVIEFLAAKITSNVRELEGALNKVIAHSTLMGRAIDLDNTKDILRDLLRSNEQYITIDNIQKKVAERYNIKTSEILSTKRTRAIARPRQVAMYLSKILTTKSLSEISKKFNKKDHSTVIHAVKTIEELLKKDQEVLEEVNLLTHILQN